MKGVTAMKNIAWFYEGYDEEGRLFRNKAHLPEYLTTIRYFDRLFPPRSRILDACAGTGRYAYDLAARGHIVTACDLVPHNVDIIRSKPHASMLEEVAVCDALDLSRFDSGLFDVVLCMGALYHLPSYAQRDRVVSQCVRVCKPGGIVVLAYIVERSQGPAEPFADAYKDVFFHAAPREIEEIARKHGLERMHVVGTDGVIRLVGRDLAEATDEEFRRYMEDHYACCEEDRVIDASIHALWIGRKGA